MRKRSGWICAECGAITLEFRHSRPHFCPSCNGTAWKDVGYVFELNQREYEADTVRAIQTEDADCDGEV